LLSHRLISRGLVHQAIKMDRNTVGQRFDMIAPFQGTHQPAAAVRVRDLHDRLGEWLVILGFQSQRADRVKTVGVKASTQQDQLRVDPGCGMGPMDGMIPENAR